MPSGGPSSSDLAACQGFSIGHFQRRTQHAHEGYGGGKLFTRQFDQTGLRNLGRRQGRNGDEVLALQILDRRMVGRIAARGARQAVAREQPLRDEFPVVTRGEPFSGFCAMKSRIRPKASGSGCQQPTARKHSVLAMCT